MDSRITGERSGDVPLGVRGSIYVARRRGGHALCRALADERRPDVAETGRPASRAKWLAFWLRVGRRLQPDLQARDRMFTRSGSTDSGPAVMDCHSPRVARIWRGHNTCTQVVASCNVSGDRFGKLLATKAPREVQLGPKVSF